MPTGTALTVAAGATLDISGLAQTVASAVFSSGSKLKVDFNTGPATKTGLLTVTGTATIAGEVKIGQSVLPVYGQTYTVLAAGTLSGTFQPTTVLLTDAGRSLQLTYPTNTVVVTDAGSPRTFLPMFF